LLLKLANTSQTEKGPLEHYQEHDNGLHTLDMMENEEQHMLQPNTSQPLSTVERCIFLVIEQISRKMEQISRKMECVATVNS